ncbi:Protein of unknown function [Bacillus wiedmannii]|nr:Protein of unknown function [Bacillus wiedmannii]
MGLYRKSRRDYDFEAIIFWRTSLLLNCFKC